MAEPPNVPQALPSLSEAGKYVVGERLATGGMAEVYKGWLRGSEGFRRAVVIKKMLPRLSGDPRFVRMFIEEARLASRLIHANIVQVLDFGLWESEHFIVLEFVDGPNLNELLLKTRQLGMKRLPLNIVVYIIGEVLKGLDHAHRLVDSRGASLGCVHRDVTPSNVLLSRDGQVKVSDFGVAKAADRASWTAPGQIKGKLHYLSPEQVRGDPVDPRADLFAVGVLLHELLTGRRLFGGDTPMQVMEATLSGPVPPPSTRAPDVPAELDAVALRALERDPAKRHPDAESFLQALVQASAPHFIPGRARDLVALLDRVLGPQAAVSEDPLAALLESSPSGARLDATQPMEGPAIAVLAATALEMPLAKAALAPEPTVPVQRPIGLFPLEPTRKGHVHPPVAQRDDRPRTGVPAQAVEIPPPETPAPAPPPAAPSAPAVPAVPVMPESEPVPESELPGEHWSLGGPTDPDGHVPAIEPPPPTSKQASRAREGRLGVYIVLAAAAAAAGAVALWMLWGPGSGVSGPP
jgi:serine/threonine protein kinase